MGANLWFLTGPKLNALQRAQAVVLTGTWAADGNFPLANIYDERIGTIFRASSLAGGQIRADLHMITNGDMEGGFTAGVPNGWTKTGSGVTADETTVVHGGAHALRIEGFGGGGGAATSVAQLTALARAGEKGLLSVWVRRNAAQARVYLRNAVTGNYLQPDLSWSATKTSLGDGGSGVYAEVTKTFTVERLDILESILGLTSVTLEMTLEAFGVASDVAYFDDALLLPGINVATVHGHNFIASSSPLTVESSPDASTWTVRSANPMTPHLPSFYWLDGTTIHYVRYWRLNYAGSPSTLQGNIWMGELTFGQAVKALRTPNYPTRMSWREFQHRHVSGAGAQWVYAISGGPVRTLALANFSLRGTWPSAEYKQFRDEVTRRSRNGLHPTLVIPQDTDPEVCVLGRLPDTVDFTNTNLNATELSPLVIVEDPIAPPLS